MGKEVISRKIQECFAHLTNVNDVVALVNLAKSDLYGDSYKPITVKQFNYHRYIFFNKNRYFSFSIKKKSGGKRMICAPNQGLKSIQTCLNYVFQLCYAPSASAYGFVAGKSVVDNARQHIGQNYIYNIDLKDFFSSIEAGRIFKRLQVKPFNLPKEVASAITDICCQTMEVERRNKDGMFIKDKKNVLPQGAPTSPILTNIICEKLDMKLLNLATRYNLIYTRYADDITFSGHYNAFDDTSAFIQNMKKIITDEGFFINEKKTRLQKNNSRQEVTGLVVSKDRVNVSKKYVKELRGILFCWEKYGKGELLKRFLPRYKDEKGHIKKGEPAIENVISGKLLYLRMVKGEDNSTYRKLQERFCKLCGKDPNQFLEKILNIWEQTGMDAAMEEYYRNDNHLSQNYIAKEKSKASFIGELLTERNISTSNKEKVMSFCNQEFKDTGKSQATYPKPQQTYDFLSFLSSKDGGLKNLTHDFNYGYIEYDEFINQCKHEFEEGKKNYPNVEKSIIDRIEQFAFAQSPQWDTLYAKNDAGISPSTIGYGWSEPNFIKWYKDNKIHPATDSFYNREMIIPFKNSIQVRADSGNLIKLINLLITKNFGKDPCCDVEISENLKMAQFYTDVKRLGQAIDRIFSTIKYYSEINFCNKVSVEYFEDNFKNLSITHIDSVSTKSANDKDYMGGDTKAIRSALWGLCNYEIQAIFADGAYKKIILSDKYKESGRTYPVEEKLIKGYTHILRFY